MTARETYLTFMLDHAAGNHPQPFALACDLHVLMSREGAEIDTLWSVIGGALLETGRPAARIHSVRSRRASWKRRRPMTAEDMLDKALAGPVWRRGLSGVQYAPAGTPGARFMKLEPGKSAPMHGHGALEATVVIQGRFCDGHGTYERGDLVIGEPGMRHKPAAVGDEPCVCFVAQPPNHFWSKLL